jgi:hypothetical protein
MPEIIDNADFGERVDDREKLSSVWDSAPQKSTNLAKIFKKVFNNYKNTGLCNLFIPVNKTFEEYTK